MTAFIKRKSMRLRDGFTLIEALLASILLGMAIAALLYSSGAYTRANGVGIDLSTAEFLIEEIRELTTVLPVVDPETGESTFGIESGESSVSDYDDLDDFDGLTFNPPVDVNGYQLSEFSSFSQQVTVENISSSDFLTVVSDHGSDFVRVTVTVLLNGAEMSSSSWVRARL